MKDLITESINKLAEQHARDMDNLILEYFSTIGITIEDVKSGKHRLERACLPSGNEIYKCDGIDFLKIYPIESSVVDNVYTAKRDMIKLW
jgi:hypothetical protein